MEISVNGQVIFTIDEHTEQVIKSDIPAEIFEEDMIRRLKWIIQEKYKGCIRRMRETYEPQLIANNIKPDYDNDIFANQVFALPTYKDGSTKRAEQLASLTQFTPVQIL